VTVIDVLNVGDGACSVIRCPERLRLGCAPTIVDCGQWKGGQREPAAVAAAALGRDLANVDTLVVTHFDLDHWGGLRALAEIYGAMGEGRRPIRLVYPRLPDVVERLPATVLAFIATATGTGVRATELTRAWKEVATVTACPLWAGDTFHAGCTSWEVLWPPQGLPANIGAGIARALDDADRLAADLARAGYPALRNNIIDAYKIDGFLAGFRRIARPDNDDAEQADGAYPETNLDWEWNGATPAEARADDQRDDHPRIAEHSLDVIDLREIPAELALRFRAVARRLAPVNNLLSLTFHSVDVGRNDGGVAVLGDLQDRPLEFVAHAMRRRYQAMLAPHHGTVALPAPFPPADICVSQAGERHSRLYSRHLDTHAGSQCVSTYRVGHVHLDMHPGR
jgi:Metallo-beta-lactamase superfamily